MRSGHFENGEPTGEWTTSDKKGQLDKETRMTSKTPTRRGSNRRPPTGPSGTARASECPWTVDCGCWRLSSWWSGWGWPPGGTMACFLGCLASIPGMPSGRWPPTSGGSWCFLPWGPGDSGGVMALGLSFLASSACSCTTRLGWMRSEALASGTCCWGPPSTRWTSWPTRLGVVPRCCWILGWQGVLGFVRHLPKGFG